MPRPLSYKVTPLRYVNGLAYLLQRRYRLNKKSPDGKRWHDFGTAYAVL